MIINFERDGTLTAFQGERQVISKSPIASVINKGTLYVPRSASICGNEITLDFEVGKVTVVHDACEKWHKLTVIGISGVIENVVLGSYIIPCAVSFGDLVGAAWFEDGAGVCIQSLNPKTVGECSEVIAENNTGYSTPVYTIPNGDYIKVFKSAGYTENGEITLQCTASDRSTPRILDELYGMKNFYVDPVTGPDAKIEGASVALICAENAEDLLSKIEELEIHEHLPHPTINGKWAKTAPETNEIYFVIGFGNAEEQIAMAEKAGVHCLYFSDPFKSWGHFEINDNAYSGGKEGFCDFVRNARKHGIDAGFHTLTNFIHTHDPYVSPIPHKELQITDKTELASDITDTDTTIYIKDVNNYTTVSPLNAFRIGDELLRFSSFDSERMCLCDCERGAFHTHASAHSAGETVSRMSEHGYGTLFPSINLQGEMAAAIGRLIKHTGIRRMSFDGVEGCDYTGHGEYARSEFVRRVLEEAGSELICDASRSSHYRWHAHAYFNWGEPWYDEDRRGGMYNYRATNQYYFRKNLLPGMLGWYKLCASCDRFEATTPETMEFILSRTVAFNAGMCFCIHDRENGNTDTYLDMIKLWSEFRRDVKCPENIRLLMQGEKTDWHLERNENEWKLSELTIINHSMDFGENKMGMESGTTGYDSSPTYENGLVMHSSMLVIDRSTPNPSEGYISEPFHCRIRLGNPGESGHISGIRFHGGWHSPECLLKFDVDASHGDYLEYTGNLELKHYDSNFVLKNVYTGSGKELIVDGSQLCGYTLHWITDDNTPMMVKLTHIRTRRSFTFQSV